ncbi:unnamed protein product, partial [Scytosiphon promiscuus]
RCIVSSCHAEGQCSNGLTGVQNEDICCEAECGTCGGNGCSKRPGGSVRWCMLSTSATVAI